MKHFCPLPWNSIEIDSMGFYKPCCLSEVITKNGVQLSVRNSTIDSARNSEYMTKMREEFIAGGRHADCNKCWRVEDAGQISKRHHAIIKFHSKPDGLTKDPGALTFIDLKAGNICNIKCRICGGTSSSRWVSESAALFKNFSIATEQRSNGSWPRTELGVWDQLHDCLEHVREFEITGGEPLLIQQQFELLELAVEKGYSKNISVHYNTNGTIYPEHALQDIWPHFKKVELAFSIDDLDQRFEYQRFPANWKIVNENLNRINALRATCPWLVTQICCSINKQNMYYLPEVMDFIISKNVNFWHFNMIHAPEEFAVFTFNENVKNRIAERINTLTSHWPDYKSRIEPVINYMMTEHKDLDPEFFNKLDIHDNYRGQNFIETFPELFKIMTNG